MEYRIGKYHWKTTEKDNAVFWANDEFWNAWPKLAQAGLIYADYSKSSPSNFGHVDIRVRQCMMANSSTMAIVDGITEEFIVTTN